MLRRVNGYCRIRLSMLAFDFEIFHIVQSFASSYHFLLLGTTMTEIEHENDV